MAGVLAMVLAGGEGTRLQPLTVTRSKPAVPFGGSYRLIDFVLNNFVNSDIIRIFVLTQFKSQSLYMHMKKGWTVNGIPGCFIDPVPAQMRMGKRWYDGTADAIYQNLNFIDLADPLFFHDTAGTEIYTMDYSWMLEAHKMNKAEATIGVIEVPWEEAPRFGIMNTDKTGRIEEFEEKPAKPKSNLASMGIYVFNKNFLKKYLEEDAKDETSSHDFGKNIIPKMLQDKARLYSYAFEGYWKDVGTIESLWQANMDLLQDQPPFDLKGEKKIYSSNESMPPHYIGPDAKVKNSMISEGSMVLGEVENSVIFSGVRIGKGVKVTNSVIMPSTVIRDGAVVDYAILAQNCEVAAGAKVTGELGAITVVAEGETVMAEASGKQAG